MTLADWAAWYDCTGKPYAKETNELDVDGLPMETFIDDNHDDDKTECSTTTFSKTTRRTKARIIRCVWFNKIAEPEKHYRELIMLFTPW